MADSADALRISEKKFRGCRFNSHTLVASILKAWLNARASDFKI